MPRQRTTRIPPTARIAVRADAGHAIGFGHIARVCAIVEEIEARGVRPLLLFGGDGEHVARWLADRGVHVAIDHWTAMATAHVLEERRIDAVIVDGPAIADALVPELGRRQARTRTLVIDDRGTPLACDAIVNHNVHAPAIANKYPGAKQLLLGRRYMMLRNEIRRFTRGSCRPNPGARLRVVVTFGGSDPLNATARVLGQLVADRPLELVVLLGPGYRDDGALASSVARLAQAGHTVDIRRSPENAAELFVSADCAIASAGGTLGELAYLGCPAIAYAIVADQVQPARQQVREGLVFGGRTLAETDDTTLAAELQIFLQDDAGRAAQRQRALATADAEGTKRVVEELLAV